MARYTIHHRTSYQYTFPVTVSHHSARLKPLSDATQTCDSFELAIQPESVDLIERLDYFGNLMHMFSVQESHDHLVVDAHSEVYVTREPLDLSALDAPCGKIAAALRDPSRPDLNDEKQFLFPTDATPDSTAIESFGRQFATPDRPFGKVIEDMLAAFAEQFTFDPTATELSTAVEQVLSNRTGVCQDFAHTMIASLRACGLAARYASGYILTLPPAGQERLVGADASHAWVSVFYPGVGWIDVDPTNQLVCGDQHIRVAYGRDYFDVSMLKGAVTGGGGQTLTVEVTVQPVD